MQGIDTIHIRHPSTVLPARALGDLPLIFCNFLAVISLGVILFSVLALSMQLPQLFGTPLLVQSVLPIYSTFFGAT